MALATEGCALLLSKYEHPYQNQMEHPEYPYQHQTGCLSHPPFTSLPRSPYDHRQPSSESSQYADLGYPLVCPSSYITIHTFSNIPPPSLSVLRFPHQPPSDLSQYADLGYPSFYPSPYNTRQTFSNIPPQSLTGASAAPPLTYPSRGENGSFQMGLTQSTLGGDASLVDVMSSLHNGTWCSMETLLMPPSPTSMSSSTATVPLTEAVEPAPKKRGPGRPRKKKSLMVKLPVSVPSTMFSPQTSTASLAVTTSSVDEAKLPVKKEDRPPKNKEPSTRILTPPSSDTSNGLPKKRGGPRKEERVQSPSRSITRAPKRPRKYLKDPAKSKKPTKAELAHLEDTKSYWIDPDDGQPTWFLPDGSMPQYLAHPGYGKKYQWGYELPRLPEGEHYIGDDRDDGKQLWENAKLEFYSSGYVLDSNPMGVEEDAEGARDVIDPVSDVPSLD
ncbi:MAG: hypothetical protein Q9226_003255 [Calogaya cf. arnoldii]